MQQYRGVNLGGWLVLERWITPSLFKDTSAQDEYGFMQTVEANKAVEQHRHAFITKADFVWLAKQGITAVRIPVGYWIFGEAAPYSANIEYLDKAFIWAQATGLKILIDLHAAPGSQNGRDHSGQIGEINWPKTAANVVSTLLVIERLSQRYKNNPALLGIELLNEPSRKIPKRTLTPYYEQAYAIIRRVCGAQTLVVFADGFMPFRWRNILRGKQNVIIDTHRYLAFGRSRYSWAQWHLHTARITWQRQLRRMTKYHPVFVGEWSLALGARDLKKYDSTALLKLRRQYASAQLASFDQTAGWLFWTYKTEANDSWNFRHCIQTGLLKLS
jgi:glucan 1,3-beta-glucosidase